MYTGGSTYVETSGYEAVYVECNLDSLNYFIKYFTRALKIANPILLLL